MMPLSAAFSLCACRFCVTSGGIDSHRILGTGARGAGQPGTSQPEETVRRLDELIGEATEKASLMGHELDVFQRYRSREAYSSCVHCNRVVGVVVEPDHYPGDNIAIFGDALNHRCQPTKKTSPSLALVRNGGKDLSRTGGALAKVLREPAEPGTKQTGRKRSDGSGKKVLAFPKFKEPTKRFSAGIELAVSGKGTIHKKVATYLKKDLKALQGVVITDSDADYQINVVCLMDNLKGYNISYYIAGTSARLNGVLSEFLDHEVAELMSEYLEGLCCVFEHRVKVGPPDRVRKACQEIVRDFDENYLREFRSIWEDHLKWS
jgi:hypothetical protein